MQGRDLIAFVGTLGVDR